jgi:hypothetical protein
MGDVVSCGRVSYWCLTSGQYLFCDMSSVQDAQVLLPGSGVITDLLCSEAVSHHQAAGSCKHRHAVSATSTSVNFMSVPGVSKRHCVIVIASIDKAAAKQTADAACGKQSTACHWQPLEGSPYCITSAILHQQFAH